MIFQIIGIYRVVIQFFLKNLHQLFLLPESLLEFPDPLVLLVLVPGLQTEAAAGPGELPVVVSIVATQPAWLDWRGGARGRPGPEWSTLIGPDPSRYCALIG